MLFLIVAIALFFLMFNFRLSQGDILDPSVLFPGVFFVQALMSVLALTYLDLHFHAEVLLILLVSCVLFSVLTIANYSYLRKYRTVFPVESQEITQISIPKTITILFIGIFLVTIYLRYQYLSELARAMGQGSISLSEKIALYDQLTKFNQDLFKKLRVIPTPLLTPLNIMVQSFGYMTTYVIVNNFVAKRKVNLLQLIILVLFAFFLYIVGSRSVLFRLITFAGLVAYILVLKTNPTFKFNFKLIRRILMVLLISMGVFIGTISLYGRENSYTLFHYIYVYLGAPLYNLDVFIQRNQLPVHQLYFGQQTFHGFYDFILPKFGLEPTELNLPFIRYNGQYGLGNVYTTFYQFLYDFGMLGVAPLVAIIAGYYTLTYRKIKQMPIVTNRIDFRLFIYAYLINDLIMLIFSNRFYETVTNINTWRMLIVTYLLSAIIFEKSIRIGHIKVRLFR